MSQRSDRSDQSDVLSLDSGLEALRQSSEFRGPVESLEGHGHSNDHFALVYESEAEQFAAAIPFLRQGLERGEKCMYVVEEEDRDEVLAAMRERGIDVDARLESGALTLESVENTYLKGGSFSIDEMTDRYADIIEEATAEYEAFRLVAETGWIVEDDVTIEEFMEYESKVNDVFDGEDAIALCLYDRRHFPAEGICDVVRVHPHLIHDNTVCHNFYYTPPEEFCGPAKPDHEVDRMLGTLQERTEAKTELSDQKRFLQRLNGVTSDPDKSFEAKLQALFELGCEQFDLDLGALNRVDPDADHLEVEHVSGDHDYFQPGVELELSETYCQAAADIEEAASVSDPTEEEFDEITVYEDYGVEAYLGTYVPVEGEADRTLAFVTSRPRTEPFSEQERTSLELMGQWVKYELEHQQYQRELEQTVAKLKQSNDRLKQFAYAASHDLQEPLRMVSSYLQLLENRYADDLDEQAQEYIDFAVDGANRMRAMVGDLLSFSRVERADNEFGPVDCDAVLERVLADHRMQIEERNAEISVGSLPTVSADGEQLEQLFANLVSNAVKYNESAPPRVEIDAEERSDCWEFTVADNGIGIDPDRADQIFEVFKRLHHDEQYPGTGIGLSLCQEIVENHDGDIWVDSEPGNGSTFHVTLAKRAAD
ncbi:MEDS domain-containing protein [Natrinema sp. 1APR25-10V2]|uniref:MEDS domain-containing protein n=1 Tax=Natrinema sp. 1APR25-10V2 TaxID=2951081 RepID=UPI0028761C37|nr:MEDS domain-containing protein [Natrinema sp. 1APR25-10V2]MDS0475410.1 MEDS domain-containing protein [Natrinema sp. 1APR25-10V2]